MPRLHWRDGITSLTNVSAVYKVGMMFTIVVVARTKEGQKVFNDTMGEDRRVDMQYAFQMLLCYQQWLKSLAIGKKETNMLEKLQGILLGPCYVN